MNGRRVAAGLVVCLSLLSGCEAAGPTLEQRVLAYAGLFPDRQQLTYSSTKEIPSRIMDATGEAFLPSERAYDIYRDEQQREFFYFRDTGLPCGYKEPHVYGSGAVDESTRKTQMEIIEASLDLVRAITPRYSEYTMVSCVYSEQEQVFFVTYADRIQDVCTDDVIRMYVRPDGSLGAYTAYALGRYANIRIADDISALLRAQEDVYPTITDSFLTCYRQVYYLIVEGFPKDCSDLQQIAIPLRTESAERSVP